MGFLSYRLECSDISVLGIWMTVVAKRMGAGFLHKLTADVRRYTQIKVNMDLNSDHTTGMKYNQICLEYLRSFAFICG